MGKPKYIIPGTVKEDQIENDVSNFFGIISGKIQRQFRLTCTDELKTGADKVYNSSRGFLIYLQYKASEGLKSIEDYPLGSRKNRSKLEDVRKYRSDKKFDDSPTLYFKLREKSKVKANDYQHNILLKHANKKYSQAIYVANLELDKDLYNQQLWQSAKEANHPFYWFDHPAIPFSEIAYEISMIPFLKEHVSIVPHSKVDTANHYYSYSELGSNIAFHSPEIVSDRISNLANFLRNQLLGIYNKTIETSSIEEIYNEILKDELFNEINQKDPVDGLIAYGKWLNYEFGIRQYLILDNRENSH